MKITGTIVYQDIEGGFWGLAGDDGRKYLPVEGLPAAFQVEGRRVEADLEPADVLSFRMWGRAVRVVAIKPL